MRSSTGSVTRLLGLRNGEATDSSGVARIAAEAVEHRDGLLVVDDLRLAGAIDALDDLPELRVMGQPHGAIGLDDQLAGTAAPARPRRRWPGSGCVSTDTPLSTADQAARLVWFTDSSPRAAFSLGAR